MARKSGPTSDDERFRLWLITQGTGMTAVRGDKTWNSAVAKSISTTDKANRATKKK